MSQAIAHSLTLPNGATLKNRLVKAAMSETLGTRDHRATPALAELYGRWADGGLGLAITGHVMIDRKAIAEPNNVAIEDDGDLPSLQPWASAGTRGGTALWMQINHPGKQAPKGLNKETVAPSAVPFDASMQSFFGTPRELSVDEIHELIRRFGATAAIAKKAGFTGVQIHGAHGYLVSQFLSPKHNVRSDDWGGNPENRRRFALEVYREVRKQVGPEFPVGIKLNSADFQKGGFTEEESLEVIRALSAEGIDLIEISGGTYEAPAMTGRKQATQKESTRAREAYFLEFAEKARSATKTPLMVTGGFRTLQGMNDAIASGATDLVGMARALTMEPDLPSRLLSGQQARYPVRPITTGIALVDKAGMMEVAWYGRQMSRIAHGKEPRPNESALWSLLASLLTNGFRTLRKQRA